MLLVFYEWSGSVLSSERGHSLIINIPSRTLQHLHNGYLLKEYPVGVGYSSKYKTPPGEYTIDNKVIDPVWEHPYRPLGHTRISALTKNPLGDRWLGFHSDQGGVYGIHGTNEPRTVGKFVSHGCVRMHPDDIRELFELISVGTPLSITYDRFELERQGRDILLTVFPDPYGYGSVSSEEIIDSIRQISPSAKIDNQSLSQAINDSGKQENTYQVAVTIRRSEPTEHYRRNIQPHSPFYFHTGSPYNFYY